MIFWKKVTHMWFHEYSILLNSYDCRRQELIITEFSVILISNVRKCYPATLYTFEWFTLCQCFLHIIYTVMSLLLDHIPELLFVWHMFNREPEFSFMYTRLVNDDFLYLIIIMLGTGTCFTCTFVFHGTYLINIKMIYFNCISNIKLIDCLTTVNNFFTYLPI